MTITNIYGEGTSGKTIVADGLKKKFLLSGLQVYVIDDIESPVNMDNIISGLLSQPQQLVLVTEDKIEDHRIDYYVNTFK